MSELERRETQFSSVQDRGESLIIARHPASPVIDAHMKTMQAKWAWLLQLTLCLETHLRYSKILTILGAWGTKGGLAGSQIQSCMSFTEKIVVGKVSVNVMLSGKVMPIIY